MTENSAVSDSLSAQIRAQGFGYLPGQMTQNDLDWPGGALNKPSLGKYLEAMSARSEVTQSFCVILPCFDLKPTKWLALLPLNVIFQVVVCQSRSRDFEVLQHFSVSLHEWTSTMAQVN